MLPSGCSSKADAQHLNRTTTPLIDVDEQEQEQRKPQKQQQEQHTKRRVRFDLDSSVVVSFVPLSPLSSSSYSSYRSPSSSSHHSDSDSDSSFSSSSSDDDDDYTRRAIRSSIDIDLNPNSNNHRRRASSLDGDVSRVLAGQSRGARNYSRIARKTAHHGLEHSSKHGLYAYRTKTQHQQREEEEEIQRIQRKIKKEKKENDGGGEGKKRTVVDDEFHDEFDDDHDDYDVHAAGGGGRPDIHGRLSLDSSLPLLHKRSTGAGASSSTSSTATTATKGNTSSSNSNNNNTTIPVTALLPSSSHHPHHQRLHHHHGQLHCPRDALHDTKLCTALFRSARCHRIVVHGATSSSTMNNKGLQRLSSTMFSILPVAALHQLEGVEASTKMSISLIRGRARATAAHDYGVCPSWPHCHGSDGAMLIALVARALNIPMRSALRFQGDAAVRAVVKAVRVRRELFLDGRPTGSNGGEKKEKAMEDNSKSKTSNSNSSSTRTSVDDGSSSSSKDRDTQQQQDSQGAAIGVDSASKRTRTAITRRTSSNNSTSTSSNSTTSNEVDVAADHGDAAMDDNSHEDGKTKGLCRRAGLRGKVSRVKARAKDRIRQTVGGGGAAKD